jgi:hypothetical protein
MAVPVSPTPAQAEPAKRPWYRQLQWVLTAIVAGIFTGWLWPSAGTAAHMDPPGQEGGEPAHLRVRPHYATEPALLS